MRAAAPKATAWVVGAYGLAFLAAGICLRSFPNESALWSALLADVVATLVIFGFSVAFKNSSFYDPYWSVAPPLLLLYWWASAAFVPDGRILLLSGLVFFWAVRLTHNWWRGWQGLDDEDWRYRNLQTQLGAGYWPVSFTGVHLMPTLWVFFGCLGIYAVFMPGARAFSGLDVLGVIVGFSAVMLETQADNQLRHFRQNRKDPSQHLQFGVWAWCRHPNYLGELGFWLAIALFATAAHPSWYWSWLGPISMIGLFTGVSIPMIEKKLLEAKPGYRSYREQTPSLLPLGLLKRPTRL